MSTDITLENQQQPKQFQLNQNPKLKRVSIQQNESLTQLAETPRNKKEQRKKVQVYSAVCVILTCTCVIIPAFTAYYLSHKLMSIDAQSRYFTLDQLYSGLQNDTSGVGGGLGNQEKFYVYMKNVSVNNQTQFGDIFTSIDKSQIQVGSIYSLGLNTLVNYTKLEQQLYSQVKNQIIGFQYDVSLELGKQHLMTYQKFGTQQQLEQYAAKVGGMSYLNSDSSEQYLQYNLAIELLRNPGKPEALQLQYYLADNKYRIGSSNKQLPFCIFSVGYNIATKNRYQAYFRSLGQLNYTNYHIVYIDDFSSDDSAALLEQQLQKAKTRLKNRIKIVHNLQRLGKLANMYFYIKKYCNEDEIVILLDIDDSLIGRQGLQILNRLYQDPQRWYIYSSYTTTNPKTSFIKRGSASQYPSRSTQNYRTSFQWYTQGVRTFRRQLLDSYHYNTKSGYAWPAFYSAAADFFICFSLLQLAGSQRVIRLDDFLGNLQDSDDQVADSSSEGCVRQHQIYDQAKSRIKTPLKKIRNLGEKGQMIKYYTGSKIDFSRIKNSYKSLISCLKKQKN